MVKKMDSGVKLSRFLEKAKLIFGDRYDYSKVTYDNCKVKIEVVCKIHGSFFVTPDRHISTSAGCMLCNDKNANLTPTTSSFIDRCKSVHGELYDYSNVYYVSSKTKVSIGCQKHGLFEQLPSVHQNGSGCPRCAGKILSEDVFKKVLGESDKVNIKYVSGFQSMSTDCDFTCTNHGDFKARPARVLHSKHGCVLCANANTGIKLSKNTNDMISEIEENTTFKVLRVVSDGGHNTTSSKFEVYCGIHNKTEIRPYSSLVKSIGCYECLKEHKKTDRLHDTETFVNLAVLKHGDVYDYSDVNYVNSRTPVNIRCKKHGLFSVRPNSHLSKGVGCGVCLVRYNSWSREGFLKQAIDKYHKLATIYLIHCYSDDESFIKVGRTFRTLKERFKTKCSMPYKYDILFELKINALTVFNVEREVKKVFKNHSYRPKLDFGGRTECLNISCKGDVLDFLVKEIDCEH